MQCPSCKETIDDDSRYCDQCGKQIMVCSKCGRPGTGKFCTQDREAMVPAGSGPSKGSAIASIISPAPVIQAVPPTAAAQAFAPSPGLASGEKIKLSSPMHGIMIEAGNGDIIGRKNGAFAGIFGSFNYISGTHCKLVKTANGWYIQDMGSTNGTFYNGSKLTPNVLYPLASGTTVTIADLDLLITYDITGDGTTRL